MKKVTYYKAIHKQYSDHHSPCCDANEHRPGDSKPGDPWFCMDCGKTREDNPVAVKGN